MCFSQVRVANLFNVHCCVGFVLFVFVLFLVPDITCDATQYMTSENSVTRGTEV
jgi:hypothetical protein